MRVPIEQRFFKDGRLQQFPSKRSEQEMILHRLSRHFHIDRRYSEIEVNAILKEAIACRDHVFFRRELIDLKLLTRPHDGSWYTRPQPKEQQWVSKVLWVTEEGEDVHLHFADRVLQMRGDHDEILNVINRFRHVRSATEPEVRAYVDAELLMEVFPEDQISMRWINSGLHDQAFADPFPEASQTLSLSTSLSSIPQTEYVPIARTSYGFRIGPILQPEGVGCAHCLEKKDLDLGLHSSEKLEQLPDFVSPSTIFSLGFLSPKTVLQFDLKDRCIRTSPFVASVDCPHCGVVEDPSLPLPVRFENPSDRWRKMQGPQTSDTTALDSTVIGTYAILNAPIDSKPPNLNVPVHVRHARIAMSHAFDLHPSSAGKGLSPAHAHLTTCGEAVERYLGALRAGLKVRQGSYAELKNQGALSPSRFLLPMNDFADRFPDLENKTLEWIEGAEILNGKKVLVPLNLVLFPYEPRDSKLVVAHQSTTGLAAGGTLESACLAGLQEVIERDAYWFFMRTRLAAPNFVPSGEAHLLIESMERAGYQVHLKNFTTDFGLPTVHALIESHQVGRPRFSRGTGSHPRDMEKAAVKAICEAVQVHVDQLLHKNALGMTNPHDPRESWWLESAEPLVRHLTSKQTDISSPQAGVHSTHNDDIAALKHLIENCQRLGKEPYVVNLSRPGIPFRVVRVLVSGMGAFDFTHYASLVRLTELSQHFALEEIPVVRDSGVLFE